MNECKVERVPDIKAKLSDLNKAISCLNDSIGTLKSRLEPVIRMEPIKIEKECKPIPVGECAVSKDMAAAVAEITELDFEVKRIINLLET